jgi:hypothetical protein
VRYMAMHGFSAGAGHGMWAGRQRLHEIRVAAELRADFNYRRKLQTKRTGRHSGKKSQTYIKEISARDHKMPFKASETLPNL